MPLWAADCPPSWPLPCMSTQISTRSLPLLFGNDTRVPALRRQELSSGRSLSPVPCPAEAIVPPRSCPMSQPALGGSCQTFLPRDIPRDTWMTPPAPGGWCHVCVTHRLRDGGMPTRLGTERGTARKSGWGPGLVILAGPFPARPFSGVHLEGVAMRGVPGVAIYWHPPSKGPGCSQTRCFSDQSVNGSE